MNIIPDEERKRLISLGSERIMHEIAEGKHCEPTSRYRDAVDALLASVKASEEAAALARAEERDEITLSISRKALRNSHVANAIAMVAIIIAIISVFASK